jgi:hypothetical protein
VTARVARSAVPTVRETGQFCNGQARDSAGFGAIVEVVRFVLTVSRMTPRPHHILSEVSPFERLEKDPKTSLARELHAFVAQFPIRRGGAAERQHLLAATRSILKAVAAATWGADDGKEPLLRARRNLIKAASLLLAIRDRSLMDVDDVLHARTLIEKLDRLCTNGLARISISGDGDASWERRQRHLTVVVDSASSETDESDRGEREHEPMAGKTGGSGDSTSTRESQDPRGPVGPPRDD